MSCISVSVGLGNIWRFPFIAYENGGGVFLVPYIILLFFIGKPMYYMEALLGQFASKSSVRMWSSCPIFMGVGIGQAIATFAVLTYYSALIAVTIYYFIVSFQSPLPWAYCREDWVNCVGSSLSNRENVTSSEKLQSSSELYFSKTVLRELDDISEGIGIPSWRLILTLLLSWIVTYLILIKGMRSLGKVAYILALFPYVILITLLIRAVTLEGSVDGIIFFLKPEWDKLLNMKVWKEAVVQCFFSLAVCFGPIVAFSSHNQFRYKVYRDAMIVTTLDTITSLVAGITIFGILGNLALNLNAPNIGEVVRSGTGLAFISYPDAIAKFKFVPQLFSVLFFFMLFVLGIGTLAALQSALVTIICDQFKLKRFWLASLITTIIEFGISILYVTPAGQWILNLVDYFAGTYIVFSLAVFEIVGITWFYVVGWILLLIGFLQFPLWGIWYLYVHKEATFKKTIKKAISPSQKWGPMDPEIYVVWLQHKEFLKRLREKERNEKELSKFKQNIYYLIGISK
ncbi:sodium-dependent nutrient amino acid transporter 1 isoform X1 [Bactrocera oleae]|uniref:sodium-dependent nutrient amino acid transporter 1 isoform X1 n=2 Tax=Bactrocera oleae TaxID=104688 RepID=UPI00387EB570